MKSIELVRHRLNPKNPAAPVDWRYQLAKTYVRRGITCSFHDDETTRDLWRFLREREASRDPGRRVRLLREYSDLSTASDVHHGGLRCLRQPMEAYLLTELEDQAVATKFGLGAE